jgi:glutamyl-tRNA reductase
MIVKVGLSHRTAPLGIREQLAMAKDDLPPLFDRLLKGAPIGEVAVLSTCNRVEVYAALPRSVVAEPGRLDEASRAIAAQLIHEGGPDVAPHLTRMHGPEALRHLFRVASSLDSLVVGEPQILGQLKDAIQMANDRRSLGPSLGKAMHRALHVGKRVRTETNIGAGQVSISSVAVDLAGQIFGDLRGRVALLVGAGEMAEAAAKLLVKLGAKLIVVNRSRERADRLAAEVGGEPRDWGALNWCLIEADIVVSSTASPTYVITLDALKTARKARRGRNLFFIDIAVPRDVDPAVNSLDGVYLYDIDALQEVVSESLAGRAAEAARAEAIVESEVAAFETWRTELAMNPIVVGLRARTRALLVAELERSLSGKLKHLGAAEREALNVMLDAATNKLCHRPTTRLRTLASDPRGQDYVEMMTDLFDIPTLHTSEEGATSDQDSDQEAGYGASAPLAGERKEPS